MIPPDGRSPEGEQSAGQNAENESSQMDHMDRADHPSGGAADRTADVKVEASADAALGVSPIGPAAPVQAPPDPTP